MRKNGFLSRLRDSTDRILLGYDLGFTVLCCLIIWSFAFPLDTQVASAIIEQGISLATTFLIVLLTGISILVTMSHTRTLTFLKRSGEYQKFLFTFEFTAMLALLTAVFGIVLSVINPPSYLILIYIFLLMYSITAVATVIARLITYGDKVATIATIEDLPNELSGLVRKAEKGEDDSTADDSDNVDSEDDIEAERE